MGSISAYLRRNVLGLVAIFLALNAGAYAITSDEGAAPRVIDNKGLRTGSVDSRVLATNAVTTPDIAPRTVGPRKIKLDNLVRYLRNEANLSCPSGEVVQSVSPDGHVTCTPAGGNGTITGISTSGGLTGGGSAGDVALGVDPSQIQSRVTGSCSGNEAVQSVGQGGGVGCGAITANGAAGGDLSGSYPNPTLGNGVVDAANFASLPGGKMVQTTCQTFPNGGIEGVDFDALSYGQGVTFDDANDTLTVSTAGTYLVTAYAEWAQNGSGDRALVFDTSAGAGTSGFDSRNAVPQTTQGQTATQLVHLPAGTSLTASAGQGSGGDLSLVDLGANCASLSVQWLAP
jgi:hypothetical protein